MKKFATVLFKVLIFFFGWMVCVSFVPIPTSNNPAVWRLWAEVIPCTIMVLLTVIFELIEKKHISLSLTNRPLKNIGIGMLTGCIWLACTAGILYLLGVLRFNGSNEVPLLGIWVCSVLINTVMQELLVRGYLYQMIKQNYKMAVSTVITTGIFTLMHGGTFEAGIIPVLNVLTMSILMTVVLEYTESLLAPIMIHFSWNAIGALLLGGVSLADDFPHLLNTVFSGNKLLSGGVYKMEGSIVVFFLNIALIFIFSILYRKKTIQKSFPY